MLGAGTGGAKKREIGAGTDVLAGAFSDEANALNGDPFDMKESIVNRALRRAFPSCPAAHGWARSERGEHASATPRIRLA
jgi:hypothetical protein